jgi:hypothetical protein
LLATQLDARQVDNSPTQIMPSVGGSVSTINSIVLGTLVSAAPRYRREGGHRVEFPCVKTRGPAWSRGVRGGALIACSEKEANYAVNSYGVTHSVTESNRS